MNTLPPHDQDSNLNEKTCTKCHVTYPMTTEFSLHDKKGRNGLSSQCRECRRAWEKEHRKKPDVREIHRSYMREYHARPEIKIKTSLYNREYVKRQGVRDRINARRRSPQRIAASKVYHQRMEVKNRVNAFYAQPHQKARRSAYAKEYYSHSGPQERRRQYQQNYYDNPLVLEHKRNWRKEYNQRPSIRARNHVSRSRRRAILRKAQGNHTPEQLLDLYSRQDGKCYYCQIDVSSKKYHIDHVVPLSRGGTNDISNLVIACPSCNLSKHNKLPHEFFKGGRLL